MVHQELRSFRSSVLLKNSAYAAKRRMPDTTTRAVKSRVRTSPLKKRAAFGNWDIFCLAAVNLAPGLRETLPERINAHCSVPKHRPYAWVTADDV
jgi:hypothetical protein